MGFFIVGVVIIHGGARIMENQDVKTVAIFTNVMGEVNRGIVLAYDDNGLVKIQWEPFTELIERILKQRPSERDILERSLGARVGWSRPCERRENGSSLVLVPAT